MLIVRCKNGESFYQLFNKRRQLSQGLTLLKTNITAVADFLYFSLFSWNVIFGLVLIMKDDDEVYWNEILSPNN